MKSITQISGFSIDRFLQVSRRFLLINRKKWAIGFAGAIGLLFVVWFAMNTLGQHNVNSALFTLSLGLGLFQLGGYVITGNILNELNRTGSASQLFTLPASTFEKLFSAWFVTYLCYSFFGILILYLFYLLLGVGNTVFFDIRPDYTLNIFEAEIADHLRTYTVYHSIFLLGAAYFRKYNFLKTALSIILFFAGLAIIFILLFYVFGGEFWNSILYAETILGIRVESAWMLKVVGSVAVTALFLVFAYLRLKNRQVA